MELPPFAIEKKNTNELETHLRAHLVRSNLGFCSLVRQLSSNALPEAKGARRERIPGSGAGLVLSSCPLPFLAGFPQHSQARAKEKEVRNAPVSSSVLLDQLEPTVKPHPGSTRSNSLTQPRIQAPV